MKILGLTGSIGMGKTTAANGFRHLGVPVFDADATVHRLQAPGGKALPAIDAQFPGTVIDGVLDRQKLGARVFADPAALSVLEALIHPLVDQARWSFFAAARRRRLAYVVLDVPLLYEKAGWKACDRIAVVTAAAWLQRKRVLARATMTEAKLSAILKTQLPDCVKRRRADFLIHSGLGHGYAFREIKAIHRAMLRQNNA